MAHFHLVLAHRYLQTTGCPLNVGEEFWWVSWSCSVGQAKFGVWSSFLTQAGLILKNFPDQHSHEMVNARHHSW